MQTPIAVVCTVLLTLTLMALAQAQGTPLMYGKALYLNMGCPVCHGEDGRTPRLDSIPIVAGQKARYSFLVMRAYKTGERQGVGANMHSEVSELLNDEQMQLLAEYMAGMK